MDSTAFDQNLYKNYVPNYKRTTDKQYNLLKRSMNISAQKNNWHKYKSANGIIRYKQDNNYWTALTEKLNNIGPPYRTLQQWKKVWSDFSRCERKRRSRNQSKKVVCNKIESNFDNEIYQKEFNDDSQNNSSINSNQHIKSETKDYEENSQSVYTTYTNEYENDYSYPDEGTWQQSYANEEEILLPDESSCASYSSDQRNLNETTTAKAAEMPDFNKPPPLQPSNAPKLQDQTLYMLQEQMGFQTKLLEHLSQMASSMASIMEQHAEAVETQTKAIHRQALATERHTAVMNTFVDMVREKMFKGNSQKRSADDENSSNEIL